MHPMHALWPTELHPDQTRESCISRSDTRQLTEKITRRASTCQPSKNMIDCFHRPAKGLLKNVFMSLIDQISQYVHAARAELLKVSWPSKRDTMRYSALVVGVSVVVAIFFGLLDVGLSRIIQAVVTRAPIPATDQAAPSSPESDTTTKDTKSPPMTITPETVLVQPVSGKAADIKIVPQPISPPATQTPSPKSSN